MVLVRRRNLRHVDVNFSEWDNTLERDGKDVLALRLGLRQIDGFAEKDADTIMKKREKSYSDFADFARRTALSRRALVTLAEADAFRGFGLDRYGPVGAGPPGCPEPV